jgi:hypothetical protein
MESLLRMRRVDKSVISHANSGQNSTEELKSTWKRDPRRPRRFLFVVSGKPSRNSLSAEPADSKPVFITSLQDKVV